MPAAKKNRSEDPTKPAVPSQPVWQRVGDSGSWERIPDADVALMDAAVKAKTPVVASTEVTYKPGKSIVFDLAKMTETDGADVRALRRLVPGVWEWKDDTGIFVQFYDEDNAMIESEWRKLPLGKGEGVFNTTNLSFNVGFNSPYRFELATVADDAGVVKGVQINQASGNKRELRRRTADEANAVWDTKAFGIAAMKPPADPDVPAAPAAAAAAPADDDAGLTRGVSFAGSVLAPPATWAPQTKPFQYFDVAEGSTEWKDVSGPFLKTLQRKGAKIISIRRIQNEPLWRFYALTRYRVAQRNGGDAKEQPQLYHGCRVRQNLDAIIEYGFDMRVARDGLAGLGIYFALSASYSNCGYVLMNPDKTKEMLVCRVAVGSHTMGKHGMKRPPPKPGKKNNGELYDSVARLPTMYVVFDNSQAYPEYLVKYRDV